MDLAPPFDLCSAPFLFNSVADMVEWILKECYHLHDLLQFLDDFITVGPTNSPLCAHYRSTAREVCNRLGLLLHPLKCVGQSPVMEVLGIELNSAEQVARFPGTWLAFGEVVQSS